MGRSWPLQTTNTALILYGLNNTIYPAPLKFRESTMDWNTCNMLSGFATTIRLFEYMISHNADSAHPVV